MASAYLTDSSWRDYGNRGGVKLHLPSRRDPGLSACGVGVLESSNPWDVRRVRDGMRCRRSGCAEAWAALMGDDTEGER